MRTLVLLSAFVVAAGSLAPAAAEACTPTTFQPQVDTGPAEPALGARYYFHWDCYLLFCATDNMGSPWLYEETNGIDGLQRADEVVDNTCGGMIAGDTIVL